MADKSKYKATNSSNMEWWEYFIPVYNTMRLIETTSDRFKPAKMAINDVIDNNIKRPIRNKLGISNRKSLTESNFRDDYLEELNIITDSIANSRYPNIYQCLEDGDTIRFQVHGNDYVSNYGGTKVKRSIPERTISPRGSIETTLGSFGVEMTKDTKTIIDIYDWNKIHLDNASTYGKLRNMMGELGTPDSIPANDKTNIKIQFKRKK